MAKYKNGINGPVSGKIGNVVGASYKGIDYLRSLPTPSAKQPSQAQQHQRWLFALVNGWLKPIRDIINVGFQVQGGSKTAMNLAVSFTMKHALGEGGIDFPKAVVSRGELFISIVKEVLVLSDSLLHIKWEDAFASAFCKANDSATFVLYNPLTEKFVTFPNAAERGDREVMLQMPPGFNNVPLHGWMQYVNAEGNAVSTSVYFQILRFPY